MTAPSRLKGLDNEGFGRAKKSPMPAVSAALTCLTTYADFITYTGGVEVANGGAWLDIGNSPGVDVTIAWTHGATPETLTLLAVFANPVGGDLTADPTVGAPPPYIPAAAATGVTPAYVNELSFTKTDWSTTTSPLSSATVKMLRGYLKSNGCRLVKIMCKVNSVTNTPTAIAYVSAGTEE